MLGARNSHSKNGGPAELIGQMVAINLAWQPILRDATCVPMQLTVGWIERLGRACFNRGHDRIAPSQRAQSHS